MPWDLDIVIELDVPDVNFNCSCEDEHESRTLLSLRTELLRRLGYSAQAANPPPGMTELLDSFLQDAQKQLYRRYAALRTERFYRWPMVIGERFYGIRDNDDGCTKRLDPYKVTWVGVEDVNGAWYPMIKGINPVLYTITNSGIPAYYEIRQCIEIFPAPDREYFLRVKGHFGLEPFAVGTDVTTIDPDAIFLLALGNAKLHYGQGDGNNYLAQATNYIGSLVAGSHLTARYVPRADRLPPIPQPIFLPVEGE